MAMPWTSAFSDVTKTNSPGLAGSAHAGEETPSATITAKTHTNSEFLP